MLRHRLIAAKIEFGDDGASPSKQRSAVVVSS
jgi:hypothetical protein